MLHPRRGDDSVVGADLLRRHGEELADDGGFAASHARAAAPHVLVVRLPEHQVDHDLRVDVGVRRGRNGVVEIPDREEAGRFSGVFLIIWRARWSPADLDALAAPLALRGIDEDAEQGARGALGSFARFFS